MFVSNSGGVSIVFMYLIDKKMEMAKLGSSTKTKY